MSIAPEVLKKVAWFNDLFLETDIRGVVIWFHGLNGLCRTAANQISSWEVELSARGGLIVYPYINPWSFLCRNDLQFMDRLIPAVYSHYRLSEKVPLVISGQSMGGNAALQYCCYGKFPAARCMVVSPLCDPADFYAASTPSRPSGAAAMHNMFDSEPGGFDSAMTEHSPLLQAGRMPDIPYMFIHSTHDEVIPVKHSDEMVAALRGNGRQVVYRKQKFLGHTAVSLADEIAMTDFISGAWQ